MWQHTLSVPTLGRQKQTELSEFEASPVCRASPRPARTTHPEKQTDNPNNNKTGRDLQQLTTVRKTEEGRQTGGTHK